MTDAATGPFGIVRGGAERIVALEPLTRSLYRHHVTVDP
jgi:hypothetical protein